MHEFYSPIAMGSPAGHIELLNLNLALPLIASPSTTSYRLSVNSHIKGILPDVK